MLFIFTRTGVDPEIFKKGDVTQCPKRVLGRKSVLHLPFFVFVLKFARLITKRGSGQEFLPDFDSKRIL